MDNTRAPCKDCPNRSADCHSKCEEYILFAKENARIREQKNMYRGTFAPSPGLLAQVKRKFKKRRK